MKEGIEYAEVYCDGASSGNPGKAGIGVVIHLPGGGKSYRISEYIGITTNNVAEYSALIRGLEKARSLGLRKIRVFMDSELLVNQLSGVYRVKNRNLKPLYEKARALLRYFENYTISHVRREMNKEADSLAKGAIEKGG